MGSGERGEPSRQREENVQKPPDNSKNWNRVLRVKGNMTGKEKEELDKE